MYVYNLLYCHEGFSHAGYQEKSNIRIVRRSKSGDNVEILESSGKVIRMFSWLSHGISFNINNQKSKCN